MGHHGQVFHLPDWALFASMPFVAAFVGYVTKLLAIEMMFRPVDFKGIKPVLGWQGIVPRNAGRMASIAMDLLLGRLIDPKTVLRNLDPDQLVAALGEPLEQAISEVAREVLRKHQPTVWALMPEAVKARLFRQIDRQVPQVVRQMINEVGDNLEQYADIRNMAVNGLIEDRAVLNKLIRGISAPEFRFIVRSGIVFGLLIGIIQAGVWAATHEPLIMPIFGGLIGLTTDWLALQMIFYPRERKRFFLVFPWQGLFHKRRHQVASDYGRLIAKEVITPDRLMTELLHGPNSDRLFATAQRHVAHMVDQQLGIARPFVSIAIGEGNYEALKREAGEQAMAAAGRIDSSGALHYAEDAIGIGDMIVEAMLKLTPIEYEDVLRPAFKQDEWKLILCGAILGALVGELQVQLFLH